MFFSSSKCVQSLEYHMINPPCNKIHLRTLVSAPICTKPTAPNWCNTLECMHTLPRAFITALVKVETSPTIHLSAYWHQKTCFYALSRDLWATTAECVRPWMHTLAACAHLAVWEGSGWCAYWHLAFLCPISPPSIHLPLNPSPSFKSLLGNPIPFISTKRLAF